MIFFAKKAFLSEKKILFLLEDGDGKIFKMVIWQDSLPLARSLFLFTPHSLSSTELLINLEATSIIIILEMPRLRTKPEASGCEAQALSMCYGLHLPKYSQCGLGSFSLFSFTK